MNPQEAENILRTEGFSDVYTANDSQNLFYPEHTHSELTAHIILKGEMTLVVEGETHNLKPGDRCDVPAKAVHSAKMGTEGCVYMIGEGSARIDE